MSKERKKKETSKGRNMSIAVHSTRILSTEASGRKRSFDCGLENDFECPSMKKFITEDDVAHYLERLRLASHDGTHRSGAHTLPPQNARYEQESRTSQFTSQDDTHRAGALCATPALVEDRQTLVSDLKKKPSPQKRSLEDDEDGRMECDYDVDYADSDRGSVSCRYSSRLKRLRLDGVSSLPTSDNPSQSQFHLQVHTSAGHLGLTTSPTLVPPCGSSCSQETSAPASEEDEVTAGTSDTEEEEGKDVVGETSDDTLPIKLWIAPEVQSLCTDQKPFLPTAVMNEIKCRGMELVPYVGPPSLLLHLPAKDDEIVKDQAPDTAATMDLQ